MFISYYIITLQNTCTIRLSATHTAEGTFAVAVTVQDFPKKNISIDNQVHMTTVPLSTVTLQVIKYCIHSLFKN